MSLSSHWLRITSVVKHAGMTARSVRENHAAALEKLDSADYALSRLIEDLADIMPMPNATAEATGAAMVMPFSRGTFEEARQRDRADAARALDEAKTKSAKTAA